MTNGARKFDNGKAPITTGLLWRFPRAVKEVAMVSAVGAEKYEVTLPDDNCLRVEDGFNRYANAIARHLVDRALDGPMNNEKGGALPPEGRDVRHLAQLIWDGLTCLEIELIEEEKARVPSEGPELYSQTPETKEAEDYSWVKVTLPWDPPSAPTTPSPHPPLNDSPDQLPLDLIHSSPKQSYETVRREVSALPYNAGRFLVK